MTLKNEINENGLDLGIMDVGGCKFMHGLNLVRVKAHGFLWKVAQVS